MSIMSNIYETQRLVEEYLLFHYGRPDEVMPWEGGPRGATDFAVRSVTEMLEAPPTGRALDLGCAVGRSSYELSRMCESVVGVDYSAAFINAAQRLAAGEPLSGGALREAGQYDTLSYELPAGVRPERVRFEQGDAMHLREDLGSWDLVHAANLLCRLTDPSKLLQRFPSLVKPGGTLILTTPCTWLEEFTPSVNWPQGSTLDWLKAALSPAFTLESEKDLPFLIRETARKFQWSVALGTRWRRRAG